MKDAKPKAYYGRCMALYGTPQEARDIFLIERLGYDVIKFPEPWLINAKKEKGEDVMETVFKPLVLQASVLFFRGLIDMSIPAGVAREIEYAEGAGMVVVELPTRISRRRLTIAETREVLREVGQR